MGIRHPVRDFLFIDESGDPGFPGSSGGFVVGCLHLTDIALEQLHRHYCAFGYFHTRLRELKSSRQSRLRKDQITDILKWLNDHSHASMSAIILEKARYTGPYLKPDGANPAQPIYFRNFLNRQLLEHHFAHNPPKANEIEVILDRTVSETEGVGIRRYLRDNIRLPRLDAVTQCDSRFVPALQFVDTMVHIVKETLFGNPQSVDARLLQCIRLFDLTHPIKNA